MYNAAFKVLRYAGAFIGFVTFVLQTQLRCLPISAAQGFTALVLFSALRSGLVLLPQVVSLLVS